MPEYVDHPVKDMRTWVEDVKWRLKPTSPERFADLDARMERARAAAAEGRIMCQSLIGGYIPTCDHGVPSNVSYANYLHYRRRCLELGGI